MMSEHSSGYEKKDISIKKSVITAVLIILFVIVSLFVMNEYFLIEKEQVIYETQLKPESKSLKEVRAFEDSVLTTYELIDTVNNKYRIPLDSALKIVADEARSGN